MSPICRRPLPRHGVDPRRVEASPAAGQAVNIMKRKLSDFCKDTVVSNVVKKNKIGGVDKPSYTRFGCKYLLEVLNKLTPPEQRAIIEKFGFGCLLMFDCAISLQIPLAAILCIKNHSLA